jgi:quercetin dioxygenase-like cupin family protein
MRILPAVAVPLMLMGCAQERQANSKASDQQASQEGADHMRITRSGERQPSAGPAEYFTGVATITPLFDPQGPSQVGAASVTFEPGARTAWHTHPLGQRLIVTSGTGWTQVEGGPVEEIRAGDIVWCPPDVRHWHGATPQTGMTHIAVQESMNGSPVKWMEHVTDEQYLAGRSAQAGDGDGSPQ